MARLDGVFDGGLGGMFSGRLDGMFDGRLDGMFDGRLNGMFDGRLDGVLDGRRRRGWFTPSSPWAWAMEEESMGVLLIRSNMFGNN